MQVKDREIRYETQGTCSESIRIVIKDGRITEAEFLGGCSGNLIAISKLIVGLEPQDAMMRLKGIHCGDKETSCPDQLALALEKALAV